MSSVGHGVLPPGRAAAWALGLFGHGVLLSGLLGSLGLGLAWFPWRPGGDGVLL
ncbi:hypothetical protein [Streptomyces sp. NPDC001492]